MPSGSWGLVPSAVEIQRRLGLRLRNHPRRFIEPQLSVTCSPRDDQHGHVPTPLHPAREDAPRADQARPGAPGQDRPARERPRRSIAERKRAATADVGMYRAVSYKDLSEKHFDGHRYATRRAIDQLVRRGLVREHQAEGSRGGSYTVLTATPTGARAAQRAALDAGHAAGQQTWSGIVKPAELTHDTAVYRAASVEQARIEAEGGRVTHVRIDAELKQVVARAADDARYTAAQALGLPVQDDRVMYPDAQLDIEDSEGRRGRVNIEIASEHYHAAAIAAKAGAGFALHGSSGRAMRNIARAIDRSGGSGSGAAQPGRDGSVEL